MAGGHAAGALGGALRLIDPPRLPETFHAADRRED
jgi:hypothetical protein